MIGEEDQRSRVDALLERFGLDHLARNAVPDADTIGNRELGYRAVLEALGPLLSQEGLRCSPLGVGWTHLVEAGIRTTADRDALRRRGWLPIDHLHRGGRDSQQAWLVIENGRPLIGVRLHRGSLPDPIGTVVERCRTAGEVLLRDVLELVELRRRGATPPAASTVLTIAADIESGLGGRDLAPWGSGRARCAPAKLPGVPRVHRRAQMVVAVSGVDGSGKTTLRNSLVADLKRAGVNVSTVWVRPGMGLGRLVALATIGKRALRQEAAAGVRAMAEGRNRATAPQSRRGVVGWTWAMLVTLAFLRNVWDQHVRARGSVVVYDRHLVDALATLDFAYEGVDLRVQHALVRWLLPRADVRLYLDVPLEVAVARKPGDLIGAAAVRRQLAAYDRWLSRLPAAHRLDARLPPDQLTAQALALVLQYGARKMDDINQV
jgi:thymidylate kinase